MKKIPTLFQRDPVNRALVLPDYNPDIDLLRLANARATVKWDGTACMIDDLGYFWKRYTLKPGKSPPPRFLRADEPDPVTQKEPGWAPVEDTPENRWHWEAYKAGNPRPISGTYELVGPKVQGNPYSLQRHYLFAHGSDDYWSLVPIDFDGLRGLLGEVDDEGVVWWEGGEPIAKIKRRDFGFPWPMTH